MKNPTYNWRVSYTDAIQKKTLRKPFVKKKDAVIFKDAKEKEYRTYGAELSSITHEERTAVLAFRGLGSPLTLLELVREHEQRCIALSNPMTVQECLDSLKASQERQKLKAATIQSTKSKLGRFCDEFGDWQIGRVDSEVITDFIHNLVKLRQVKGKAHGVWEKTKTQASDVTKNSLLSRVNTLFNHAVKIRAIENNPCNDVDAIKESIKEVEVYSPNDVARLLQWYPERHAAAFLLHTFAGLRKTEIQSIKWENIDLHEKAIHLHGSITKTGKSRTVTISDNLSTWLQPYAAKKKLIFQSNRTYYDDRHDAHERAGLENIANGGRHSFGTYFLAKSGNKYITAEQMGNSPDVIEQHYKRLVKPSDAAKFWDILPENTDNVTQITAS